jgi:hypothetical protein
MSAERFERLKRFLIGPWIHDGHGGYIFDAASNPIAQVRGWGSLTGIGGHQLSEDTAVEVQKARGDLLAAAPDLYEAAAAAHEYLSEILSPFEKDCDCMVHSLAAVLAKARGEV